MAGGTQQTPRPSTRRLSRGRKLAFTLASVVLVLLACEAAVRLRAIVRYGVANTDLADDMTIVDPKSGLQHPRPGYRRASAKGGLSIQINSLGFRGDEIAREKPPRTLRIACLGASTTFCAEVSENAATWPHQLQLALAKRYPDVKVEVVNAGVGGYVAATSRKNLEQRVLPLAPDLVIYYEANNDMAVDVAQLARAQGLSAAAEGSSGLVRLLSRWSLLFNLVHKNAVILRAGQDSDTGKLASVPRDTPERFVSELDKIHAILRREGIPLVMSAFVVKYRRGQDRKTQLANASIAFYYIPWLTIDGLLDANDLYNDALREYAGSRGVPFVADRDSIPADAVHFADWCHLRDAGARLMAERFAKFFDENKILDEIVSRKLGEPKVASRK